ncbi:MAG: inositol monophosphatase family protein [Planctomycetota bacterium]
MSQSDIPNFFIQHSTSLQLAARAAAAAGKIIRDGYDLVHQVETKGVGDLVSKVDFDADRAATEILKTDVSIPTIVSEELNPDAQDESQDMWIVDPLDGTTAYLMKAGPQFPSVLIAKRINGATKLGITYFPLSDEWFYAEQGQGAWRNGVPLKIKQQDWQLGECWIEMNQYGNQQYETPFFQAARTTLRAPGGARIVTSTFPHAGVAMRIAEQRTGLTLAIHDNNPESLKQGPWDIAANQIIFEEAGGVFVNPDGKPTSIFIAEPIIIAPHIDLAQKVIDVCLPSIASV